MTNNTRFFDLGFIDLASARHKHGPQCAGMVIVQEKAYSTFPIQQRIRGQVRTSITSNRTSQASRAAYCQPSKGAPVRNPTFCSRPDGSIAALDPLHWSSDNVKAPICLQINSASDMTRVIERFSSQTVEFLPTTQSASFVCSVTEME